MPMISSTPIRVGNGLTVHFQCDTSSLRAGKNASVNICWHPTAPAPMPVNVHRRYLLAAHVFMQKLAAIAPDGLMFVDPYYSGDDSLDGEDAVHLLLDALSDELEPSDQEPSPFAEAALH